MCPPLEDSQVDLPLLTVGAALVLAYVGAHILRRAGIPQTLGFMVAGIFLGLTSLLTEQGVHELQFFVSLALGLIGYNIGHELRSENLSGGRIKRLAVIVIFEATAAFGLVTVLTYWVLSLVGFEFPLPTAILFGAVASATAPAATADVVWECECKGPLTSSLMFVLAADDIAAIVLTNSAISFAVWYFAETPLSVPAMLIEPILGIFGSILVGLAFGFAFLFALNRQSNRGMLLELEVGMILVLIGFTEFLNGYFIDILSLHIQLSDIFAAMVFGYIVRRYASTDKQHVPMMLERLMSPVVMIFFVLVGARMAQLLTTSSTLVLIALAAGVYVAGRTIAKYVGASVGGRAVREDPNIQKYLGTCLFCQAGVALGLSFIIEEQFLGGSAEIMGMLILGVVALSTMVLEIIGPIAVKRSVRAAGELPVDEDVFDPHEVTFLDMT
jgi:Kef-type K+ transport system membrane component KefB